MKQKSIINKVSPVRQPLLQISCTQTQHASKLYNNEPNITILSAALNTLYTIDNLEMQKLSAINQLAIGINSSQSLQYQTKVQNLQKIRDVWQGYTAEKIDIYIDQEIEKFEKSGRKVKRKVRDRLNCCIFRKFNMEELRLRRI